MAQTTVAKVNGKAHVTELDALSDAMEREYAAACAGGETAVAKDAVLKGLFAQLTDLSARNTPAAAAFTSAKGLAV